MLRLFNLLLSLRLLHLPIAAHWQGLIRWLSCSLGLFQTQVVSQGAALVFGTEYPAPLQFRHDLLQEAFSTTGHVRRHHHEAVGGVFVESLLNLIGDGLRRADEFGEGEAGGIPAA